MKAVKGKKQVARQPFCTPDLRYRDGNTDRQKNGMTDTRNDIFIYRQDKRQQEGHTHSRLESFW